VVDLPPPVQPQQPSEQPPSHQSDLAPVYVSYPPLETDGVLALVLSLLWIFGVGSIIGICLDHSALKRIRLSRGRLRGEGTAIAGLVLGYAGLIPVLLLILILILAAAAI
jgi:hypothetical protein